jgi:hypothetical protein
MTQKTQTQTNTQNTNTSTATNREILAALEAHLQPVFEQATEGCGWTKTTKPATSASRGSSG